MKELLKKYQTNELNAADTEGVEKRLVEQAVERESRQKWATLLTENGIERSVAPQIAEVDAAKDPVFMMAKRTSQRRLIIGIAASLALVACFWWWDVSSTSALDLANTALFNERFAAPSVSIVSADVAKISASELAAILKDTYFTGLASPLPFKAICLAKRRSVTAISVKTGQVGQC